MSSDSNKLAFIALGSNLGDSQKIIRDAIACLQNLSDEPILKSSLWQTSPVNCPPGSRKFVNAVVGLYPRKGDTPELLLEMLRVLEVAFGRAPKIVLNEPRPLDLDLIAFGNEARNTPDLILPHPRAHLRKFVLEPLNEIAPDFIPAGQGTPVSQLLAGLSSDETVVKIASPIL